MEKYIKRKARKDYTCVCDNPIKKGEEYWFYQVFVPKEDDSENHFWISDRLCLECHLTPEQVAERQEKCPHKHVETSYSYIPGEAVKEPDYDYCVDCGKVV